MRGESSKQDTYRDDIYRTLAVGRSHGVKLENGCFPLPSRPTHCSCLGVGQSSNITLRETYKTQLASRYGRRAHKAPTDGPCPRIRPVLDKSYLHFVPLASRSDATTPGHVSRRSDGLDRPCLRGSRWSTGAFGPAVFTSWKRVSALTCHACHACPRR